MENLTHSLLGAAMAEAALPSEASRAKRTAFYVAGILAANLPDADLLYTAITPAPLGYLLHHRGHTHTVVGLIGLALIVLAVALGSPLRRRIAGDERRFAVLTVAALASHLAADGWNSYGVHPFYPLSNRWFYGDAVYILEPWLWIVLGVPVAMSAHSASARRILSALLAGLPIVAAALGMIDRPALVPLAAGATLLVLALRRRTPRVRAWTAIAAAGAFVGLSFAAKGVVKASVMSANRASSVVDVVLNPRPANIACWSAIVLSAEGDSLVVRRGQVPIAGGCGRGSAGSSVSAQSILMLRALARDNCAVRAWLQFGRVPEVHDGWIIDSRFGGGRGNFTAMQVAPARFASQCPAHLTSWDMPRGDVLALSPSSAAP
jgi:inner membrane protein